MENEELPRISASQLAEMGYCERKIVLAARFGPRCSPEREKARAYGELQHVKFFVETLKMNSAQPAAPNLQGCSSIQTSQLPKRTHRLRTWLSTILPRWLTAARKANNKVRRSVRAAILVLRAQLCRPRHRHRQKRRQPRLRLVARSPERK